MATNFPEWLRLKAGRSWPARGLRIPSAANLAHVSSIKRPNSPPPVMQSIGGPFSNAARNLGQLRRSPACWIWLGIVMGIQSAVAIAGGPDRVSAWSENFGLSRSGFLAGKLWQVFSYSLLHGGWWHAGLNALFVLLIGSRIEHMAGYSP